jgi:hypothetical protein
MAATVVPWSLPRRYEVKPIDKELETILRTAPDAPVRTIVRTASYPGEYVPKLQALGLRVLHISSLINAITVEGPATAVLALGTEDWVVRLESDKPVHTMDTQ